MNVRRDGDSGPLAITATDIPRYVNGHIRLLRNAIYRCRVNRQVPVSRK